MLLGETGSRSRDRDLKQRVKSYLFGQHVSDLRRVAIDADGGVVTLRGNVKTFHYKQLCLNCCQRVAGVVKIDDQIQVAQ
jgi:osmotically-inducible protein OsmY